MLRLSRRVKFKNIKWHIMGTSSFELEQSLEITPPPPPAFLINSASVGEERGCYYFKGLILIQKSQKCFKLHGVYVSSVADLGRTKKRVKLRLGQNATDVTGRNKII